MVQNTETELLAEDWNPDDEAYSETEDELEDDYTGAAQEYQHQLTEFNRAFKDSPQFKKSAILFGSVSQSPFYRACEQLPGVEIIAKFHQSGIGGFLPLSDPGVCSFMSDDFARSVTEGRYDNWRDKVIKTDQEFVERLRAGQYDGDVVIRNAFNLGADRPFSPSTATLDVNSEPVKMEKFQLASLAEDIHERMKLKETENSCLDAPCIKLDVKLERPVRWKKEDPQFGHSMMFTMAVDEKGRLDKEHLLFMDANSGIIKIKNDKHSIEQFLQSIDTKLFSEMRIKAADIKVVKNPNLPQKDTPEWKQLDDKIMSGNAPDKESNYAQCKLCQLDNYLKAQIARLEHKGMWERISGSVDQAREEKLNFFLQKREELHKNYEALKSGPVAMDKASDELFKQTMKVLDESSELGKKRGLVFNSTAGKEFNKFKGKYKHELEEIDIEAHLSHVAEPHSSAAQMQSEESPEEERDDESEGQHLS